jgi:transposase
VPPRVIRQLRASTRQRAQLPPEHTRVVNRIHNVLVDSIIKLATVAANVMGNSGRAMLRALLHGEQDPVKLAELALTRMRSKIPQLQLALEGNCTEHHRYLLGRLLSHASYLEGQIDHFRARITPRLNQLLAQEERDRLDRIPGVNRTTMENVLAEIGVDMSVFPDEHHLSSWCGICPGNEETAGRRLRGRTRKGNVWLRRALTEAAWAARRTKKSYFAAQYRRLAGRRGKQRATLAVAHSLLVTIYHMLKHKVEYRDLGPDYFDRLEPQRLRRYLVKRLQALGYDVTLTPKNPGDRAA